MINKEEIEKAKERLKGLRNYRRTYSGSMWFNVTTQLDIEGKETIDTILQYISELEEDNKNQKEINKEHQKINGNLQKRITELEEICKGKSIQEMGTSNLYKEDKR